MVEVGRRLERQRHDPADREQRVRMIAMPPTIQSDALARRHHFVPPRLGQVDLEDLDEPEARSARRRGTAAPTPPSPGRSPAGRWSGGRPGTTPSRCRWRPAVMTKTLSKMRNASRVRNSTATMIAAFMFGIVTFAHPLPPGGAVDLRGLLQHVGHLREAGQQQQRDERRRLPDLRQADHEQATVPSAAEPVGVGRDAGEPVEPGVHEPGRQVRTRTARRTPRRR